MATIEEALYTLVTGRPLIGDIIGTRLYPLRLPQNPVYPAMVYQLVSARWPMAHDGPADMGFPRVQFDCYAASYGVTKILAKTLRREINGFVGTAAGVEITGIFFLNEIDEFGSQAEVYRVSLDFRVNYKE